MREPAAAHGGQRVGQQRRKNPSAGGARSAGQRHLPARPRGTARSVSGRWVRGDPALPAPVRSVVCGLQSAAAHSTAGPRPGAKMTPGGGSARSRARIAAR